MGPKKNKITASTPAMNQAVAVPSVLFGETSGTSDPSTINEPSLVTDRTELVVPNLREPTAAKVSTLDLICNAIVAVGVPKKGASYIAIRKWIINNKENANIKRLKSNMKKAFIKALETGLLKRPAKSKDTTGLRGYFVINSIKKLTAGKTSARTLAGKTKTSKPRTASVPTSKPAIKVAVVKSKSNPEAGIGAKPKTKVVQSKSDAKVGTSAKPKTKAAKSKSKVRTNAKQKTKAVESESDAEAENSAKPKTKAAKSKSKVGTSAKTKAVESKSDSEAENIENPKSKAVESESDGAPRAKKKAKAVKSKADAEIGSSDNPKAKATVKTKPHKEEISKTKADAGKSIADSENLPVHKPKVVARVNGVKVQEKVGVKQASKKFPKAAKNVVSSFEIVVKPHARRLFTPRIDPETNMSRKDLSDTELNVRPDNLKSLKSYSSDTEVEATKTRKSTKATKNAIKKIKKESSAAGPSKLNNKQKATKNAIFEQSD